MHKLHLILAFLAAFTVSGCISTGGSSEGSDTSNASSAPQMSDSELTAAVSAAFKQDSQLSGVSVAANDGVVTLSGEAPNQAAKDRAGDIAKAVQGVSSVSNNLTVKAG